MNVTQIGELGQLWNSDKLQSIASNLEANDTDANVGSLNGNRMFYANDYMVRHTGLIARASAYRSVGPPRPRLRLDSTHVLVPDIKLRVRE